MAILFGVIFLGAGLTLLLVSSSQRKKAQAAESWPTAPGVILSSTLQQHQSFDSEDQQTTINYEPQVQYQYSVMGQIFTGNSIAFGKMSYDYRTASRKIAAYPQGAAVTVHFNPDLPSQAVLEAKAAGGVLLLVLAILFVVIGAVVLIGTIIVQ